ncbi:hypothetical protein SARU107417_04820 [Salinibacter ruber]
MEERSPGRELGLIRDAGPAAACKGAARGQLVPGAPVEDLRTDAGAEPHLHHEFPLRPAGALGVRVGRVVVGIDPFAPDDEAFVEQAQGHAIDQVQVAWVFALHAKVEVYVREGLPEIPIELARHELGHAVERQLVARRRQLIAFAVGPGRTALGDRLGGEEKCVRQQHARGVLRGPGGLVENSVEGLGANQVSLFTPRHGQAQVHLGRGHPATDGQLNRDGDASAVAVKARQPGGGGPGTVLGIQVQLGVGGASVPGNRPLADGEAPHEDLSGREQIGAAGRVEAPVDRKIALFPLQLDPAGADDRHHVPHQWIEDEVDRRLVRGDDVEVQVEALNEGGHTGGAVGQNIGPARQLRHGGRPARGVGKDDEARVLLHRPSGDGDVQFTVRRRPGRV